LKNNTSQTKPFYLCSAQLLLVWMPKKPFERSPVFRRLDLIKASIKREPREKKVLLRQLRRLGKTDFRKCSTYELENVRNFLETFFLEKTLSSVSGLKKRRQEVLNRVLGALAERGIFPEHTIVKLGGWQFDANVLREKVERNLPKEAKIAAASASTKADPLIAGVLKNLLDKSAARDFLEWRKKNPQGSFYAWLNARRVKGRAKSKKR